MIDYLHAALWVLNIVIYSACIWLWARPEPPNSGSRKPNGRSGTPPLPAANR